MVQTVLSRLEPAQRTMMLQMLRFAGGIIPLLVAASYWAIAEYFHVDPMISLAIVFVFFSGVSYVTHGAFSFKDQGARGNHHVRGARFFAINILGFLMNQLFVWTLVKQMHGPTWWPLVPAIFVTPLATFALNKRLVFR